MADEQGEEVIHELARVLLRPLGQVVRHALENLLSALGIKPAEVNTLEQQACHVETELPLAFLGIGAEERHGAFVEHAPLLQTLHDFLRRQPGQNTGEGAHVTRLDHGIELELVGAHAHVHEAEHDVLTIAGALAVHGDVEALGGEVEEGFACLVVELCPARLEQLRQAQEVRLAFLRRDGAVLQGGAQGRVRFGLKAVGMEALHERVRVSARRQQFFHQIQSVVDGGEVQHGDVVLRRGVAGIARLFVVGDELARLAAEVVAKPAALGCIELGALGVIAAFVRDFLKRSHGTLQRGEGGGGGSAGQRQGGSQRKQHGGGEDGVGEFHGKGMVGNGLIVHARRR